MSSALAAAAPVDVDADALRAGYVAAMANLAGGVTIVTAYDAAGRPAGMTATSVVSVSADPPLVAVSLTLDSATLRAVRASGWFCVNLLDPAGRPAAQVFASRSADKFAGVRADAGPGGPVLADLSTHALHCEVTGHLPAGDHLLLLGRVDTVHTGHSPVGAGLVYWRRNWHQLP